MIVALLVTVLAVVVGAYILPGVKVDGLMTAIVVAVILAVVNAFIKPLVVLLTLPITILTLGLFMLVINVLMLWLVDYLVPGFTIDGFWWAVLFSVVLSAVNSVFSSLAYSKE
jgi:putative membrane protein